MKQYVCDKCHTVISNKEPVRERSIIIDSYIVNIIFAFAEPGEDYIHLCTPCKFQLLREALRRIS